MLHSLVKYVKKFLVQLWCLCPPSSWFHLAEISVHIKAVPQHSALLQAGLCSQVPLPSWELLWALWRRGVPWSWRLSEPGSAHAGSGFCAEQWTAFTSSVSKNKSAAYSMISRPGEGSGSRAQHRERGPLLSSEACSREMLKYGKLRYSSHFHKHLKSSTWKIQLNIFLISRPSQWVPQRHDFSPMLFTTAWQPPVYFHVSGITTMLKINS